MVAEEILDGVIKELALSYRDNPEQETFEKILYRLDNLVLKVVNVAIRRCPHLTREDPEDLYKVAIIGLYNGLKTVKKEESSGITIARLMAYMKSALIKEFPYKVLPEDYILSQDRIVKEETVYQDLEFEFIQTMLDNLVEEGTVTEHEMNLVNQRYLDGADYQVLANQYGCSVSKIGKQIRDAILVIRYHLRRRGVTGF